MNRETYEEIKKRIQDTYDADLAHLEALEPHFGKFNPKTPLNGHKTALKSSQKPEMKVLKEMPENGIIRPVEGVLMRISPNSLESGKYVGKLLPCEVKDCTRKTQPGRKCPSCTKRVCTRHLRGKVCKECNERGEN